MSIMRRTYRLQAEGDEGGEGEGQREAPAVVNARQNRSRVDRMKQIADRVDGARAADMQDFDGERITGNFSGGDLDESPEAVEARAMAEDETARVALEEEEARAAAAELQGEGAGEGGEDEPAGRARGDQDQPEERVRNGVREYLVVTPKGEKWLTFPQLRAQAQKVESADEALQRANDAVKQATQLALAPREEPGSDDAGDDIDYESVLNSAVMGDRDAIKQLASALKKRPSKTPDVSREVAQAIATRSAVVQAETEQRDIFEVDALVPIFKARLKQIADVEPTLTIAAAYKKAGAIVRKEFAPMLKAPQNAARRESKQDRKRTLVNPPAAAARQAQRADEDGEESPTSVIDQIAKARGQNRAIRHGRNLQSS